MGKLGALAVGGAVQEGDAVFFHDVAVDFVGALLGPAFAVFMFQPQMA